MDEAFRPLPELLPELLPLAEPISTADGTIRTVITGCTVQTPVELDLTVTGGSVVIGGAPPLYHLETSETPVFHSLRLVVESAEAAEASPAYIASGTGPGGVAP